MKTHRQRLMRYWKYLRDFYHIYLSLPVSALTFTGVVYYLMAEEVQFIRTLFPNYRVFLLFCVIVGVPLGIYGGWLHNKKGVLATEQSIAMENNPIAVRHNVAAMELTIIFVRTHGIEPPPAFMQVYEFWKKAQQRLEGETK